MTNISSPKQISPRSAARLAAVQALYQIEQTGERPALVMAEFRQHRLGKAIDDETIVKADDRLFIDIVDGVTTHADDLTAQLGAHIGEKWSMARLNSILRHIIRAGAYELAHRKDIPPGVVISEYVEIAHGFVDVGDAAFVNGILDKLAKS